MDVAAERGAVIARLTRGIRHHLRRLRVLQRAADAPVWQGIAAANAAPNAAARREQRLREGFDWFRAVTWLRPTRAPAARRATPQQI